MAEASLMQPRKPVDLSRLANRKANYSVYRPNLDEESQYSTSSKSFEVKTPEAKFKVAHTPNFGKKEDWLPKQKEASLSSARAASVGTSNRMSSQRQFADSHSSLNTFGRSKSRVPQLPLESLLEESTERRTLNLSTINYSIELNEDKAERIRGTDQDASTDTCYIRSTFHVDKSGDSEELLDLLDDQEANGTLLLSPVVQQKAFSRLDESSIVDPLSNILVDKTTETSNKENQKRSILRRGPELDKQQLKLMSQDIEVKLQDIRKASQADYSDLKSRVRSLSKELEAVKTADVPHKLRSALQETVHEVLDSLKQNFLQDKQSEIVELVTREIAKHLGNEDSRKSNRLKREYEDKVKLNQEYIDRLKKQNQALKTQVDQRREPSLDKYRALVSENLRLKEELSSMKHRVQSYNCVRCREKRDLLGDDCDSAGRSELIKMQASADVWNLASAQVREAQKPRDRTLLVLGERKSGKTSLLQTFLSSGKEETPKSTVALEYSYARAPAGLQVNRDICHIYELGGGRMLHSLVPIVITPEVLPSLVVAIVVDLSAPHKVLESYLFWLQVLKARIDECISELRVRSPKLADKLEVRVQKQWAGHEDRSAVVPFPVPVVVVASKYDVLASEESEKRKWMARCLRYFSHRHGVDLLYNSQRDTRLQGALRQTLSAWVFGGAHRRLDAKDHSQPVLVTSGADSFQQIGPPPSTRGEGGSAEQLWERALSGVFPKPQK